MLNKVFINGIGTDSLIAYDTDERTLSDYNIGKLSFCDNRVFPYESEFTAYAYTGIINDCNSIILSDTGVTTTQRYYTHTNHQGSIISLTDSSGTVIQRYEYDLFGNVYVVNSTGTGTISLTVLSSYTGSLHENTRLFTGREYDKETSLYFMRARYYDSKTGKFINRDPIGQNDQINLYTYVANSPMLYVDRMGKKASSTFVKAHDATKLLQQDMISGMRKNIIDLTFSSSTPFQYFSPLNTKNREDYKTLAFDPNTKESCSGRKDSWDCVVYIDGDATVTLSQIGNFLIGYNYNYAGFTLDDTHGQMTNDIYQAGLFTEDVLKRGNFFQNPAKFNEAVENEKLDRPYYSAGYYYAEQERNGHALTPISDHLPTLK